LSALPVLFVAATLTWLVSLPLRNVAIVDSLWSLMLFAAGVVYALGADPRAPRLAFVLWLLAIWAARLSIYITARNIGKGEDRRYQEIRARNEPHFQFKSLYLVFWLQAGLAWIISLPLLGAFASLEPLGVLDWIGLSSRVSSGIPPTGERSWIAVSGDSPGTLTISASSASGGGSTALRLAPAPGGPCPDRWPYPSCCCAFRASPCWKRTSAIGGRDMPTTS
jgi:hypothetical protein